MLIEIVILCCVCSLLYAAAAFVVGSRIDRLDEHPIGCEQPAAHWPIGPKVYFFFAPWLVQNPSRHASITYLTQAFPVAMVSCVLGLFLVALNCTNKSVYTGCIDIMTLVSMGHVENGAIYQWCWAPVASVFAILQTWLLMKHFSSAVTRLNQCSSHGTGTVQTEEAVTAHYVAQWRHNMVLHINLGGITCRRQFVLTILGYVAILVLVLIASVPSGLYILAQNNGNTNLMFWLFRNSAFTALSKLLLMHCVISPVVSFITKNFKKQTDADDAGKFRFQLLLIMDFTTKLFAPLVVTGLLDESWCDPICLMR